MWADRLALGLRPRPMHEAADLGVRMVQESAGTLARTYGPAALIAVLLAASAWKWMPLAPTLVLCFLKPWLDRALLHVFARTAFGQPVAAREVWQREVLLSFSGFMGALTSRRLSPWRAYTQAVGQLEQQRGAAGRARRKLLLRGKRGVALLEQGTFLQIELMLTVALMSLVYWFTPFTVGTHYGGWGRWLGEDGMGYLFSGCQMVAAVFIEPFFVAAGFSMYLNRRVELEAWDVEQELRRAFSA
jgi:hypothetical protein